ncbi:hypothetical protein D3C72_2265820 [compost metagenome]
MWRLAAFRVKHVEHHPIGRLEPDERPGAELAVAPCLLQQAKEERIFPVMDLGEVADEWVRPPFLERLERQGDGQVGHACRGAERRQI